MLLGKDFAPSSLSSTQLTIPIQPCRSAVNGSRHPLHSRNGGHSRLFSAENCKSSISRPQNISKSGACSTHRRLLLLLRLASCRRHRHASSTPFAAPYELGRTLKKSKVTVAAFAVIKATAVTRDFTVRVAGAGPSTSAAQLEVRTSLASSVLSDSALLSTLTRSRSKCDAGTRRCKKTSERKTR